MALHFTDKKTIGLEIRKINVKPGDVLHIKVGGDIGYGMPYIPTPEDLETIKTEVEKHLPEGVTAYVTYHLVEIDSVVRPEDG